MFAFVLANANIIFATPGTGGATDPQCQSGGPGSTSCSGSWSICGVTTSCSVTCGSGSYACCYLELLEAKCICKSNSKPTA